MSSLAVAILGATGAVGEALLARLAGSELGGSDVRAYASRAMRKDSVSFGERSLPVRVLSDVFDDPPNLAFSALPPPMARKVVPELVGRGCFVVDVGNATAGVFDAPLVSPFARPSRSADMATAGGVRTPSAIGWLAAGVLAPLLPLGARRLTGLVNLPASAHGQRATDELSEQVVASFNLKDPPRRIFSAGLAFDTLPEEADAGEWSERELLGAAEVGEILGIDPGRCAVQVCTQPVFAGMTAALHVSGPNSIEAVERALTEAEGLSTAARQSSLRPRKVMGKGPIFWGGLRPDPSGDGIHLWIAADNLAGAGAAAPIAAAEAALAAGLLTKVEA